MAIEIPYEGSLNAFAMIVDINGFTRMVMRAQGRGVALYVHDVLTSGVRAVESQRGHVVGFMGDAFLALLSTADEVFSACVTIAKSIDRQCQYIAGRRQRDHDLWHYSPGGPSLKIAIEYGSIDVTRIGSASIGDQPLLIGAPINYASRIARAGEGNRCLFGPAAAAAGLSKWGHEGPETLVGKGGEPPYTYYHLSMRDIWQEGERVEGEQTFQGPTAV